MDALWATQRIRDYFTAAANRDVELFGSFFTEDAVLADPVGMPVYIGRERIQRALLESAVTIGTFEITPERTIVGGNQVAVAWRAIVHGVNGVSVRLDGLGFFTFTDEGLIKQVDEFYDASLLARVVAPVQTRRHPRLLTAG